jgi:hypothetical protein
LSGEIVYTRDKIVPHGLPDGCEYDEQDRLVWNEGFDCISQRPNKPGTDADEWVIVDTSKDYKTGWRRRATEKQSMVEEKKKG